MIITRRELFRVLGGALASAPFITRFTQWYGTTAQWAVHSAEGCIRLWNQGRLVLVPPSTFQALNLMFVKFEGMPTRWLGYYANKHGRIMAFMDRRGDVWWARQP